MRAGQVISAQPTDFNNPFLSHYYYVESGGSTTGKYLPLIKKRDLKESKMGRSRLRFASARQLWSNRRPSAVLQTSWGYQVMHTGQPPSTS